MAEAGSYTYKKVFKKPEFLRRLRLKFSKWDLATICIGFFLAMASPLPGIAPFGISYLARERSLSLKGVLLFLAVSLGGVAACGRLGGAKYIAAGLVYLGALFVLRRGVRITEVTASLVAGGAVLVSGVAALLVGGATLLDAILLLCEVAVTASATLMMEKSVQAVTDKGFSLTDLDGDTRLSLCAVVLIALLGLRELYLGSSLSLMMVAATAMLLIISVGCGAGYSTGAGVVLGVVCGIGSDFFMPILGAFSFCGFLAGMLSGLGKGGTVAGVVLANGIMAVYTGTAMEQMLSLYEVLVASAIFGFVPTSLAEAAKAVLCADKVGRESIVRLKSGLKARLNLALTAIENMAKTIGGFSAEQYDTAEDVSVIFDRAADKVCQKCRKSSICWGKDFDTTYEELFKLLEVLRAKGVVKPEDITERLGANCLNSARLTDELNHQYDIYRVHRVWNNKITESRKLVGSQLGGMGEILRQLNRDIDAETGEAGISAFEIRSRLEMSGIRVKDISIADEAEGGQRVELIVKAHKAQGRERRTIEKVVKSISGCGQMTREEVLENKKLIRLVFSKEERFRVEADHASRGVDEKNGDSFRMIHLKGGKFVIALSDGMGTGEHAARESQAILELIDSFLEAGFDCRTAVRMINSIMIMRSEENFVTLDLCIIDLYTGETRFIKTGAEPSFIQSKGGRVRTIKASSLPVGLVAEARAEVMTTKIQDGDRIVMMTDGVSQGNQVCPWVGEFLESELKGEALSKEVLDYAIQQNRGAVRDDMTVLSVQLKAVG